ncbi:hypothetical protein AB4090_09675 [Acidithiobacillus sp. IBUN Pt1247-S3]|uniref:hypothetical protein n=1 Tax=Acidithiobacillus sp. IBUN Pt1247-S3 TaxID=3166642 RepID=UPI0034E445BC
MRRTEVNVLALLTASICFYSGVTLAAGERNPPASAQPGTSDGIAVGEDHLPPASRAAPNLEVVQKRDTLHTLADALAASPVGGNVTRSVLLTAARQGDFLPAISWSLAHGYWGLAQVLIANNPQPTPRWARLSLALHTHDSSALAHLLRHPQDLPARDRMQAQMDLGRYRQARRDALLVLQKGPFDRLLRRQYLEAVRESGSYVDLAGSWQSFNGLNLYGPRLRGRLAWSDRWSLIFDADALSQSASAASQLLRVPAWSSRDLLGLRWQDPRWQIEGLVGTYRGERSTVSGRFSLGWQATDNGELSANFDYHDRSLQSPALAVAGMTNRIDLQWAQRFGSWLGNITGGWSQYQGQDGKALGSDRYGEVSLLWRHSLGPWELQLGPFADYHNLTRVSQLQGVLADVMQPDARNPDLVLPGSYADVGLRMQWGAWQRSLASDWSPYFALSVYENTRFGPQYQVDAGVSTAVFGPDRLRIGFAQGQGGNGLALNQRMVRVGYRFYF